MLPLETITRLERGLIAYPSLDDISVYGRVCGFTPNDAAVAFGYIPHGENESTVLSQAFEAAKLLDEEMQEYISKVVFGTLAAVKEKT